MVFSMQEKQTKGTCSTGQTNRNMQKVYYIILPLILLTVNVFAPGGSYETHNHSRSQFYYVLSGKAKMNVGDEVRIVEPYWPVNEAECSSRLVSCGSV